MNTQNYEISFSSSFFFQIHFCVFFLVNERGYLWFHTLAVAHYIETNDKLYEPVYALAIFISFYLS